MNLVFRKKLLIALVAPLLSFGIVSCNDDDDNPNPTNPPTGTNSYAATINMKQMANGIAVELNTPGKPYSNAKGQSFNISRLRYLISNISFNRADGSSFVVDGYHFVSIADTNTFTYTPSTKVPEGNYTSISFTFGFDENDNNSGAYPDLNTANWGWPAMLGGGYHFMQLEGEYDSVGTSKFFATHMGTARNNMVTPPVTTINHFIAMPANSSINVASDFSFDIVMNVEQWYEGPYEWDFNIWNTMIMPNYNAQLKLNENGPSVFTIMNN